jgi:two-component system sensor histidine kinase ResE
MVNNLLDTSKIESGVMQYNLQPFDISILIRKAKVSFEPILQDKKANFIFSVEEPLWVIGDRGAIESAINDLIGNAAKYTSEEGFVEVVSENNGTSTTFAIRDNGPGIPPDFMPFIFQRFRQARGAKSGTGLGLYIAKNILEGHQQSLTVKSEEGKGTTFSFSLEKAYVSSPPAPGDK